MSGFTKYTSSPLISKEIFEEYQHRLSSVMDCEYYGQQSSYSLKSAIKIGRSIEMAENSDFDGDVTSIDIELLKSQVGIFFSELKRDFPEYFI